MGPVRFPAATPLMPGQPLAGLGGRSGVSCATVLGEKMLLDGETRRALLRMLQDRDQVLSLTLLGRMVGGQRAGRGREEAGCVRRGAGSMCKPHCT